MSVAARKLRAAVREAAGAEPTAEVYASVARRGVIEAQHDEAEKEDRQRYSCHSFGAQFVEVKVDVELGTVRVTRGVGAFAAGKIVKAKTARSQLMGGMVWGIGLALLEHTERDARTARDYQGSGRLPRSGVCRRARPRRPAGARGGPALVAARDRETTGGRPLASARAPRRST